ncbi:hypothetical protein KFK09_001579 [Dendrobium nobile]|uniref:Reverse transcriptase zinc-binding domain-containing protein n=1 Tax=Dendrobium nobile TaxID=94219 RepID=A0A8T3C8K0_DENNO|nr:hypothetical protein KFK09_001579 [Dendrobium nobile]
MCSRFLYFGDLEARKLFLIAWKKTCRPKQLGGLGIPNLASLQFANCCSLILRFYNSKSMLFRFLNAKYGTPWTPILSKASSLWNDMNRTALQITSIISFDLKANSILSFLWDPWLRRNYIMAEFASLNLDSLIPFNATVSDFLGDVGWLFPDAIPFPIALTLQNFGCNHHGFQPTIRWDGKVKACFSAFIKFYHRHEIIVDWFKLVWHKHYALRYSSFIWLALINGLKTAEELIKRNIMVNSTCSLCFVHFESNGHIYFECDYAFNVLTNLIPMVGEFLLRPRLIQVLHFLGEHNHLANNQKELFLIILGCATYFIWRERNERRFNGKSRCYSTLCLHIKKAVEAKITNWKSADLLRIPWVV